MRYQKLQSAYIDFTHAVLDDVFGPNGGEPIPEDIEEEGGQE